MTPVFNSSGGARDTTASSLDADLARLGHWIDHPSALTCDDEQSESADDIAQCRQFLIEAGCGVVAQMPVMCSASGGRPSPDCDPPGESKDSSSPLALDKQVRTIDAFSAIDDESPHVSAASFASQYSNAEFVGVGGFGIVFRVHDQRLDRDVALKILRPSRGRSPAANRRFLREAQAVGCLDHPGIVRVFESGFVAGQPYIATAYVNGLSLSEYLRKHDPPSHRQAAWLVARVAEAVHFAHAHGVLHRDLKPANILLKPADSEHTDRWGFEPQITDFGLAKRLELGSGPGFQTTRGGVVMGTIRYMSPEQAAGRNADVGIASDVFSLGIVLYELTVGRRPFDGDSDHRILHAICEESPELPRKLSARFSADLEAIIMRCLAKSPAERYGTAAELSADLRRFLDGAPVTAAPITAWRQLRFLIRKRPLQSGIIAGTIAVILVSAVIVTTSWLEAAAAIREKQDAIASAELSLDVIDKSFYEVSESLNAGRTISHEAHLRMLQELQQFHRDFVKLNPESQTAIHRLSISHHHLADGFARLARWKEATENRQACVDLLDQLLVKDPNNTTYLFQKAGGYLRMSGECGHYLHEEAVQRSISFRARANSEIERLIQMKPTNINYLDFFAAARVGLAGAMLTDHRDQRVHELATQGINVSKRLWAEHPSRPALAKHAISGLVVMSQNEFNGKRYSEAAEQCREAWVLYQEALEPIRSEGWVLDQEYVILSIWCSAALYMHQWEECLRLAELAESSLRQQITGGVAESVARPEDIVQRSLHAVALRQLGREDEAAILEQGVRGAINSSKSLPHGCQRRLELLKQFTDGLESSNK